MPIQQSEIFLAKAKSLGLQKRKAAVQLGGEKIEAEFTYYHAGSSGAGRPTVVLVHGTPSSLMTWTDVVFGGAGYEGLAKDCDVWAFDMIGAVPLSMTARRVPQPASTRKMSRP